MPYGSSAGAEHVNGCLLRELWKLCSFLRLLLLHPSQVIEPDLPAEHHVQVAIPRVLAVVRTEGLSGPQIRHPRTCQQGLAIEALVLLVASGKKCPEDAPGEWQRRQGKISQEGVFAKKAHRREDISRRSLVVSCCVFAIHEKFSASVDIFTA